MKWMMSMIITTSIAFANESHQTVQLKDAFVVVKHGSIELKDKRGESRRVSRDSESALHELIRLRQGESVSTTSESECSVLLPEAGTVLLKGGTSIRLPSSGGEETPPASLELLGGKLFLDIDQRKLTGKKKEFRVKTPTSILAVKGTRFFVDADGESETTGVHEGLVHLLGKADGNFIAVSTKQIVMTNSGTPTRPRAMVKEEEGLQSAYNDFAIEFIPAERLQRKFETSFEVNDDPATAIYNNYPRQIKAEKSVDHEGGPAIKTTILPYPKAPDVTIWATTKVSIPTVPKAKPEGIFFHARATDIIAFTVTGSVEFKRGIYQTPSRTLFRFPKDAAPGEWVPFYIPLVPLEEILDYGDGELKPGVIALYVDPNMHEKRAIESIVNVVPDKPEYILELSPLMLGVKAGEKK